MREATTGGKTIADAAKTLSRTNRVSGTQGNIERRYYAAKKGVREAQRDAIARVLLRQSGGRASPWNGVSAFANCGRAVAHVRGSYVPCVDGSVLARAFFTFCSIGRCSHVFGLSVRFT
jgi:hypothetical protein